MSILNGVSSSDCLLMNGCVDVSRFRPCFLNFVLSASNSDFIRFGMYFGMSDVIEVYGLMRSTFKSIPYMYRAARDSMIQTLSEFTFIDIKSTAFDLLKLSLKCALRTGFGPISRNMFNVEGAAEFCTAC